MSTFKPATLALTWECLSNQHQGENFLAELSITHVGEQALPANGWALYFNTCRMMTPGSVTGEMVAEHVHGDLSRLRPGPGFGRFLPGTTRVVRYSSAFWAISESDAPLGFYLVHDDATADAWAEAIGDPDIRPFKRPEQCHRHALDQVPLSDPAHIFTENLDINLLPATQLVQITPTPLMLHIATATAGATAIATDTNADSTEVFLISANCHIVHLPELASEAHFLQASLHDLSGLSLSCQDSQNSGNDGHGIHLRLGAISLEDHGVSPAPAEAYTLSIKAQGIVITGASAHGVMNGIQSLRQLCPISAYSAGQRPSELALPYVEVVDAPRFAYRGLMLDVVRHFSSKETVLRLLDCMALYKLNKFHFHLTDDEGWRLVIEALPELTEFSGQRGFSVAEADCLSPSFGSGANAEHSAGSGFYSRSDFIEILRFAKARHIDIIPEINLPGHARAAIKAMEYRAQRLQAQGKQAEAEEYLLSDPQDQSNYQSVQLWRDNVICIAKESCYRFIETVLHDIHAMYVEADVKLTTVHTGGDEVPEGVWQNSTLCQSLMQQHGMQNIDALHDYFLRRYHAILQSLDVKLAGWEEIALTKQNSAPANAYASQASDTPQLMPNPAFIHDHFQTHVWNNAWGKGQEDLAYQLANAGYPVVLCNGTTLYFDLAYAKDPKEPGYYWGGFIETRSVFEFCPLDIYTNASIDLFGKSLDPSTLANMQRLNAQGKANILGMQAQLWSENARNRERVEYFLLPRLIALAERAWAKNPVWSDMQNHSERQLYMQADWRQFANRLGQRELPRLDYLLGGFAYRIPLPGLHLSHGLLHANLAIPGLKMRYTVDGTEPNPSSPLYNAPLPMTGFKQIKMAAFSSSGRRGRSSELIMDQA